MAVTSHIEVNTYTGWTGGTKSVSVEHLIEPKDLDTIAPGAKVGSADVPQIHFVMDFGNVDHVATFDTVVNRDAALTDIIAKTKANGA